MADSRRIEQLGAQQPDDLWGPLQSTLPPAEPIHADSGRNEWDFEWPTEAFGLIETADVHFTPGRVRVSDPKVRKELGTLSIIDQVCEDPQSRTRGVVKELLKWAACAQPPSSMYIAASWSKEESFGHFTDTDTLDGYRKWASEHPWKSLIEPDSTGAAAEYYKPYREVIFTRKSAYGTETKATLATARPEDAVAHVDPTYVPSFRVVEDDELQQRRLQALKDGNVLETKIVETRVVEDDGTGTGEMVLRTRVPTGRVFDLKAEAANDPARGLGWRQWKAYRSAINWRREAGGPRPGEWTWKGFGRFLWGLVTVSVETGRPDEAGGWWSSDLERAGRMSRLG